MKSYLLFAYLALIGAYTYGVRHHAAAPATAAALDSLRLSVAGYVGTREALNDRALAVLGAEQVAYVRYHGANGRPLWLFMGYFGSPRERSQIHSPKHCYPGSGWTIHSETTAGIPVAGQDVLAKRLLVKNGNLTQLVVYWFQTDRGVITDEYALKWDQMKSALLNKSRRTTFVRFSTHVGEDEDLESVHAELVSFIEAITPDLLSVLTPGERKT